MRHQVAASLGEMPKDARLAPIVTVLQKYGDDDVTVDAAVSSLNGQEADALAKLVDSPGTVSRVVIAPRKGPGVAGGRAGTVVPGLETVDVNALTPSQAQAMAKPGADAISQLAAAVAHSHDAANMGRIISLAVDTNKPAALPLRNSSRVVYRIAWRWRPRRWGADLAVVAEEVVAECGAVDVAALLPRVP